MHESGEARRRKLIEEELLSDTAAMERFLEERLQSIAWPRETNVSFEICDGGHKVMLDVDLPEVEDMPTFAALATVNTVTASGFSQRANPATGQVQDDYLLSVKVERPKWVTIDFAQLAAIDVVESLASSRSYGASSSAPGSCRP